MPEAKSQTFASWYRHWISAKHNRVLADIRQAKKYVKSSELNVKEAPSSELKIYHGKEVIRRQKKLENYKKRKALIPGILGSTFQAKEPYIKLLAHPFITGIIVDGNYLRIATRDIKYDNWEESMGRFEIIIPDDNTESIKIHNLDWISGYGNCDHPHIQDGRVCLGNFDFYKAEDSGQLYLVIDSYIHYLLGADNSNHCYIGFADWFKDRVKLNEKKQ